MTALFIQRLNSPAGEAERCQREEDDYERYRSFPFEKRTSSSSSFFPWPPPTDTERQGRGSKGGVLPPPSHSSFFSCQRRGSFTARQIMLTKGSSPTSAVTSTGSEQDGFKSRGHALTAVYRMTQQNCVFSSEEFFVINCWEVLHQSTFS